MVDEGKFIAPPHEAELALVQSNHSRAIADLEQQHGAQRWPYGGIPSESSVAVEQGAHALDLEFVEQSMALAAIYGVAHGDLLKRWRGLRS
jgi:hypothetical protein